MYLNFYKNFNFLKFKMYLFVLPLLLNTLYTFNIVYFRVYSLYLTSIHNYVSI